MENASQGSPRFAGSATLPRRARRAAAITAATLLTLALILSVLSVVPALRAPMDFGSFIAAGQELASGNNPYSDQNSLVVRGGSARWGIYTTSPNLNPPISLFAFGPLATVNPVRASNVWRLATLLGYAALLAVLWRRYRATVPVLAIYWAVCLAGIWHTIEWAQIYVVLMLFATLSFLCIERNAKVAAGISLGVLLALKPNFIIWALLILASGQYLAAGCALATAGGLYLLALWHFGWSAYVDWFGAIQGYAGMMSPGNNSLEGLTSRFGVAWLGPVLAALMVSAALHLEFRGRGRIVSADLSGLGITLSLLASPLAWPGYSILLVPFFMANRKWGWPIVLAAAILAIPTAVMLTYWELNFMDFVVFGWMYGWALLALAGALSARLAQSARTPSAAVGPT